MPIYLHDDKDQLLAEVEETKKAMASDKDYENSALKKETTGKNAGLQF